MPRDVRGFAVKFYTGEGNFDPKSKIDAARFDRFAARSCPGSGLLRARDFVAR